MSVKSIRTTRTAKPSSEDPVFLVFSGRTVGGEFIPLGMNVWGAPGDAHILSRFTVRVPLIADVARRRRARPGDMLSVVFEAYKLGTTPAPSETKTTENGDQ